MTDNEIIKALRLCRNGNCSICTVHCTDVRDGAYNLINRQKAEIERLTKENNRNMHTKERYAKLYAKAKAKEVVRNEAIKEFAERLSADRVSNNPVVIAATCLLKEMSKTKESETE